jgi:hypothetical protein
MVLVRTNANDDDSSTVACMGNLVSVEELELSEGHLHLVDGVGEVDELDDGFWRGCCWR